MNHWYDKYRWSGGMKIFRWTGFISELESRLGVGMKSRWTDYLDEPSIKVIREVDSKK